MSNFLFSRYPGNKSNYNLFDGGNYDAVIECFGGSASFSQQMMARGVKQVFLADTDPSVRAVYDVWTTPHLHHDFYCDLRSLQAYFAREPEMAWNCLKSNLNHPKIQPTTRLAAASLTLRYLTFGGVVRCNADGKLNVTYAPERLETLKRWKYTLPPIPKNCEIQISADWQCCLTRFEAICLGNREAAYRPKKAILLLDPPYYSDRSLGVRMTPAYPGHQPHDPATLDLCMDALSMALSTPNIDRIVMTNYVSNALEKRVTELCEKRKINFRFTRLAKMDQMQRKHSSKTQNVEGMWEFGELQVRQANLFAALGITP